MASDGVRVLPEVETSPQDERSYRMIELEGNKLQVLLIHDAETDKASCAMDVGVGSFFDGDVMGLAHFCEHMLFLGTEAYPDEQAYSKFLNQHGGSSNAYTDMDHTCYYFDVNPQHLTGALDRFSAFFVSPLFTPSATEREMKAVDSENEKSIQNDMWRVHMLQCSLAKPSHPMTKFRCGSLETLLNEPKTRGVDVRDRLLSFHAQYYSANIMRLVVLGRESLDELQALVVERFKAVKNLDIPRPTVPGLPYGPSELCRSVEVVPVMQLRSLDMSWPMRPFQKHYSANPARYLTHLMGHEGKGSIIAYLKHRGWANELMAGPQFDGSEWCSLDVSVELTDEGVKHATDVLRVVYHYIHHVLLGGVQKWVWEEVAQTSANTFRFLSKSPPIRYTSSLCVAMHKYPPPHIISGHHLVREFDPSLIEEMLSYLTPSNMMVTLVAKSVEGTTTHTEKWYGAAYSDRPLDAALVKELAQGPPLPTNGDVECVGLHLPVPNDFIPSDFTLKQPTLVPPDTKVPVCLVDGEGGRRRLWYKHDSVFKQPKTFYQLQLVTPALGGGVSVAVSSDVCLRIITELLNEYAYQASVAGLHYSLSVSSVACAVTLAFQGYSHKLPLLAQTVIKAVSGFELKDEALFHRIKDKVLKEYENELLSGPYQLALKHAALYLYLPFSTQDKLDALEGVTVASVKDTFKALLDPTTLRLEALVYGNVTESDALSLFAIAEDTFLSPTTTPLPPRPQWPIVKLSSEEEVVLRTALHNKDETNHGIQVLLQVGPQEVATSAPLDLLTLLIKDEAFNQLRTKQQLGYVVFCSVSAADRYILALSFLVQSTHDPEVVCERVEAFIQDMHTYLADLPQQEFESTVAALVESKLERAKNYAEQGNRYWNELTKGSYLWGRAEEEAEAVKQLTKQHVLDFFHKYVSGTHPSSERCKLTALLYGSSHPLPTEAPSAVNGNKRVKTLNDDFRHDTQALSRYPPRPSGPVTLVPAPRL